MNNLFKFLNILNLNILKLRIIILLLYLKYLIYIFYEKKINRKIVQLNKTIKTENYSNILNCPIYFNHIGIFVPFYKNFIESSGQVNVFI